MTVDIRITAPDARTAMRGWLRVIAATVLAIASPAMAQHWARSWAAAVQAGAETDPGSFDVAGRTLRQLVRISAGGERLRLRLSNEETGSETQIGAVHVAIADRDGRIVAGSDREVRFSGRAAATMAANAPLVSDPVALRVPPLSRVAISIYFPHAVVRPTIHPFADETGWLASGDQTGATSLADPVRFDRRALIAAIDVESAAPRHTVVAFGDSITDGARSTPDADRRWPDLLAQRLHDSGTDMAVANAGIGGNRVLRPGAGDDALARFDRDALAVPGVSHVIVLEGINDLGVAFTREQQPLTADDLIAGYRQLIVRAHQDGVRLILATILPYKGAGYYTAEGDRVRGAVNAWIRTNREADGMIDFNRAVADRADPARIAEAFDSGDHLHPGDAGMKAMADAIDLRLIR